MDRTESPQTTHNLQSGLRFSWHPAGEYLLLLAHPAINIPITESDEIAERYSTPILISQICRFLQRRSVQGSAWQRSSLRGARLKEIYQRHREPILLSKAVLMCLRWFEKCLLDLPGLDPDGCITAATLRSIQTNPRPSSANKVIAARPTSMNSDNNASAGLKWLFNHS